MVRPAGQRPVRSTRMQGGHFDIGPEPGDGLVVAPVGPLPLGRGRLRLRGQDIRPAHVGHFRFRRPGLARKEPRRAFGPVFGAGLGREEPEDHLGAIQTRRRGRNPRLILIGLRLHVQPGSSRQRKRGSEEEEALRGEYAQSRICGQNVCGREER